MKCRIKLAGAATSWAMRRSGRMTAAAPQCPTDMLQKMQPHHQHTLPQKPKRCYNDDVGQQLSLRQIKSPRHLVTVLMIDHVTNPSTLNPTRSHFQHWDRVGDGAQETCPSLESRSNDECRCLCFIQALLNLAGFAQPLSKWDLHISSCQRKERQIQGIVLCHMNNDQCPKCQSTTNFGQRPRNH